jgi:hypothetical protein
MEVIAKHIPDTALKYKIYEVDTHCAFTCQKISKGVKLHDLISENFTDWEYIKADSGYVGLDMAKCIGDTIKGKTRNNALRNYSYYANADELIFMQRQDVLALLLQENPKPFRVAVSFNYKKHTSYKTTLNTSANEFIVTTDLFNVVFVREKVLKYLPIMQNWYSIVAGKETTAAQPTYFTKDEILNGNAPYHKQIVYGLDKFEIENEMLKPFRNTNLITLITHLLNKKQ